jgi:hypothetical protein
LEQERVLWAGVLKERSEGYLRARERAEEERKREVLPYLNPVEGERAVKALAGRLNDKAVVGVLALCRALRESYFRDAADAKLRDDQVRAFVMMAAGCEDVERAVRTRAAAKPAREEAAERE